MVCNPDSPRTRGSQLVDPVSFVELKAMAEQLLPRDSALRMLIVAERDLMPRNVGLAKVEVFSRLLYKELESH